jgi:hypothetical protein
MCWQHNYLDFKYSLYVGESMKTLVVVLLTLVAANESFAQLRFAIPLTVTDGVDTYTLYFGIVQGANFCVVESDSVNGHAEYMLPPMPPSGVFDARMVWPRGGSNAACFDQGTLSDFRPFVSWAQRDTFRMKAQLGAGAVMLVSWPSNLRAYFSSATYKFTGSVGPVTTDMLNSTIVDITDAGDPATATIYTALGPTGIDQNESGLQTAFALDQNYPNPFNPSATIRYVLPIRSFVNLSVYNMLGQQMAQPVNGEEGPGKHTVVIAGEGWPSGVYYYRLQAGKYCGTMKMVLMK